MLRSSVEARLCRFLSILFASCSLGVASIDSTWSAFTFEDVDGPAELRPTALLQVGVGAGAVPPTDADEPPPYPAVNEHEPGEPMAFECGRFDMGHHCSAEEDQEMEAAEQCQIIEDEEVVSGSFVGCCRQVRINFLNQNFKKTPVVVASVLRPAELAHATFSTTIKRRGSNDAEGFTVQLTREDECNCKARGDCHSWCASVEVLWMAYGPAFRDKRLGTGHFLGEYKHPYEAEVDYTPYLKKFPYRRPGEYGRDGVGKGRFEFPLTGNPGFDMLIKGAAYSHLSSRTNPLGRVGDTGGPRPKEWMLVSALLPTTLIASTEVWSVSGGAPVPLVANEGARMEVVSHTCPEGSCLEPGDYLALVPIGAPDTQLGNGAVHPNEHPADKDRTFGCEQAKAICAARGGGTATDLGNCGLMSGDGSLGSLRANVDGYPAVAEGYQVCVAKRPKDMSAPVTFVLQAPGDPKTGEPTGPPFVVNIQAVGREIAVADPAKVASVLQEAVEKRVVHPTAWTNPSFQILQVRLDKEGSKVGEELTLQKSAHYTLVVYKHGKRAVVGDWVALVPKADGFTCRFADLIGNSQRIEADWHVGPFVPEKSGAYELCWAPAGNEGLLENGKVRTTTPSVAEAPAENDAEHRITNWWVQAGVEGARIAVNVEGGDSDAEEGGAADAEGGAEPAGGDLERSRPGAPTPGPTVDQLYQQFVGAPPVHRILRPIYQHTIAPGTEPPPSS